MYCPSMFKVRDKGQSRHFLYSSNIKQFVPRVSWEGQEKLIINQHVSLCPSVPLF